MTTETDKQLPRTSQLLPCPFCGTPDPQYDNCDNGSGKWYSCRGCPVIVKVPYNDDLEKAWNTRHESLKGLVGELVDALRNSNIEIQAVLETAKGLSDLNVEMLHLRHQANEAILTKAKALQPAAGE